MSNPSTPSGHLLQLLPEAVVQTDALWQITYLNPAWHTRTGHAQEAALGRSLLEFVHPDDIGTLRAGMPVFRLRFANADYHWVRLQLHPETDAVDRVISRQGVLIEITEVTEQVLVEVRQRFLRLLETIDGVVWEAEIGVGNTFLSPQVERLFGYSVEEWRADSGFGAMCIPMIWRRRCIDDAAYDRPHSDAYEMSYRLIAKSGRWCGCAICAAQWLAPGRPNR
ncbi:MAG: PAS domain-containing protein [Lysobacterales bacterium]